MDHQSNDEDRIAVKYISFDSFVSDGYSNKSLSYEHLSNAVLDLENWLNNYK
ncbi:hypothetical protein PIROE2DRAFT_2704, partial [Piromyces sp. E2]